MNQRSSATHPHLIPIDRRPPHGYGRRTRFGMVAIRFLAFIAVGIVVMGLLNRPGGDFASSVDMTPHATATATVSR